MSKDYGMTMNMSTVINGDDMEVGFKYDDTYGGKVDVTKKGSLDDVDTFLRQVEREAVRQYRSSMLPKADTMTAGKVPVVTTSRVEELEAEVKRLQDQLDQMTAEKCGTDREKCKCDKPAPKPALKKHTSLAGAMFGMPELSDFLDELFSI